MEELKEYAEFLEALSSEFEPFALEWLREIEALAPGRMTADQRELIIKKLFTAFIKGMETGEEETQAIIDRNNK